MSVTAEAEVNQAVSALARAMYLHYCQEKDWSPYPAPWVPRWAMDYARIAVDAYGFDEVGLTELVEQVGKAA